MFTRVSMVPTAVMLVFLASCSPQPPSTPAIPKAAAKPTSPSPATPAAATAPGPAAVSAPSPQEPAEATTPQLKEQATLKEGGFVLDSLLCLAFSPDGKMLVAGSQDHTIKVWDVVGRKMIGSLQGHGNFVGSVAYSPDGKILASGSSDQTVKFWDVASGKNTATLKWNGGYVSSVSFTTDGKTLAAGGDNSSIALWDVTSGKNTATVPIQGQSLRALVFSPDSKTLAAGVNSDGKKVMIVQVWDNLSGKTMSLQGHTNFVHSVAFAPDGKSLASASQDNTIRLWDVGTGKSTAICQAGHPVMSVAFHPKGKLLASAGGYLILWDVESGKQLFKPDSSTENFQFVAFSPDGKTLATLSRSKIILWDVLDGSK